MVLIVDRVPIFLSCFIFSTNALSNMYGAVLPNSGHRAEETWKVSEEERERDQSEYSQNTTFTSCLRALLGLLWRFFYLSLPLLAYPLAFVVTCW